MDALCTYHRGSNLLILGPSEGMPRIAQAARGIHFLDSWDSRYVNDYYPVKTQTWHTQGE